MYVEIFKAKGDVSSEFYYTMLTHGFMKNFNIIFNFVLQRGEFQRCMSVKESQ